MPGLCVSTCRGSCLFCMMQPSDLSVTNCLLSSINVCLDTVELYRSQLLVLDILPDISGLCTPTSKLAQMVTVQAVLVSVKPTFVM
jgi:hypothetical protein